MRFKKILIGYTGFVGSNLAEQTKFDKYYNSTNINTIIDHEFDVVICAGVRAVKWLANQEPQADLCSIEKLKNCLSHIKINHLVLISTIDIYDNPIEVNEDSVPDLRKQDYYGKHRYQLEQWVAGQSTIKKYTIIRLPGLFGNYLKKNLIFDIMSPLATSINQALWQNLKATLSSADIDLITTYYTEDDCGNLQQKSGLTAEQQERLIASFASVGFSTLNFTDSRSSFQFYNLENLWADIQRFAIDKQVKIVNLSSEPITAAELVHYVNKQQFINYTNKGAVHYAVYSKFALDDKYLYPKSELLEQISQLIARKNK